MLAGIVGIILSQDIYSHSQTILPWVVNSLIALFVFYMCRMSYKIIFRIKKVLKGNFKCREKILVTEAQRNVSTSYNSKTHTSTTNVSYCLVLSDGRKFSANYNQYHLACMNKELIVVYMPWLEYCVSELYSLEKFREMTERSYDNEGTMPHQAD